MMSREPERMLPCRKCGEDIAESYRGGHEEFCKGDYDRILNSRDYWRNRARKAEARHPTPHISDDVVADAAKWRAFASSRFKMAGSAGFDHSAYPDVTVREPDALHFGLEIWPGNGADAYEQYVHGRNLLMAYVNTLIGASH